MISFSGNVDSIIKIYEYFNFEDATWTDTISRIHRALGQTFVSVFGSDLLYQEVRLDSSIKDRKYWKDRSEDADIASILGWMADDFYRYLTNQRDPEDFKDDDEEENGDED